MEEREECGGGGGGGGRGVGVEVVLAVVVELWFSVEVGDVQVALGCVWLVRELWGLMASRGITIAAYNSFVWPDTTRFSTCRNPGSMSFSLSCTQSTAKFRMVHLAPTPWFPFLDIGTLSTTTTAAMQHAEEHAHVPSLATSDSHQWLKPGFQLSR